MAKVLPVETPCVTSLFFGNWVRGGEEQHLEEVIPQRVLAIMGDLRKGFVIFWVVAGW